MPQLQAKLAAQVAARIEHDISERGWPVGEVLGSESELLDHYEVSRGVFREAVRLVEHKQVARMRRGPGGGLLVTEPDAGPVIDAITVYLRYAEITLAELFEARRILEVAGTELAARSLDEDSLSLLADEYGPESPARATNAADAQELHHLLSSLTGNPGLELFVDVLTRVTALYVGSLESSDRVKRRNAEASHHAHVAIVDALLRGNPGLAAHRMDAHLEALAAVLEGRGAVQSINSEMLGQPLNGGPPSKLAEEVARGVFRDVAERGWPVGEVLGSEADLISTYDVSRSVLREAVRLLEHHQVARMRRGPGGGLVVTAPGTDAVADAVTTYLDYRGVTASHLFDLRVAVELGVVDLAARRVGTDGAERLNEALRRERDTSANDLNEASHALHVLLADESGNRVLRLFLDVLVRLSARHVTDSHISRPLGQVAEEVHRTHEAIAQAVIDGDAPLARHRMQRHLVALAPHLR